MPTVNRDNETFIASSVTGTGASVVAFPAYSVTGLANSVIGAASSRTWTVSLMTSATTSIYATETTPANIAAVVATLVYDLKQKGVI